MWKSLFVISGMSFIVGGIIANNIQNEAVELTSWFLIALGVGLLLIGLTKIIIDRNAQKTKAAISFAKVDMKAILLSMVYHAMKERQDDLSPKEEIKLRQLLDIRAGIKLDDKSFETLIQYAKSDQQDYMSKISAMGNSLSPKAKLMIVEMSYLVIAADHKVEKSEVENILEIAKLLNVSRNEAISSIEDIDKSQDEIAAALSF